MAGESVQHVKSDSGPGGSADTVLRAAGLMGFATFLSRIMGLVREQVFAFLFGAGNATDAFYVAFRIPNLLRDLFAEGAMSASLVPTFTQARIEEGDDRAWRLAGLVFRVLFCFVSILAVLGVIFAPQLVTLYASAFQKIPGKFELTVSMTRTMFPFFPLVALAAAFMGILNACNVFFMPAFASALFNLGSIIVGVAFSVFFMHRPDYGIIPIEGMAIGVVFGGAVQALCQLPQLYRAGYKWRPKRAGDFTWFRDPGLRRMLWMMIPGTVGLAATQVNILVNTILATSQGPGAVSWLSYAFRLMQFPIGIFGVSLASATLPRISKLWVEKKPAAVGATITQSLRQVFAINLPASAGLAFLGFPIIQMIFQYGHFRTEDAQATALALAMYSVGLTAYSAVKVLVPACYALGNTRVPVISSVLAVILTITLNLVMVKPFGYWGLALGTSLAAIFNGVFLLVAIRSLLAVDANQNFKIVPIFRSFLENLLLATAMGLLCWVTYRYFETIVPDSALIGHFGRKVVALFRSIKVLLLVSEGVIALVVLAKIFRLRDTSEVIDFFLSKVKKKLARRAT